MFQLTLTQKGMTLPTPSQNIKLHVKRVFISDDLDGELFPQYLSFVKGVVDSNDLPLNVSREILQESRIDYEKFWEKFGKYLKVGCIEDHENQKRIAPLLRFFSSQSEDEIVSLDEYVENMKPDQKDIYFIAADSVNMLRTHHSWRDSLKKILR